MALAYSTDNIFSAANYNMSRIPQITPPNMTVVPGYEKPDLLASLIPRTAGDMSAYSKTGAPMSVPAGTRLSQLGTIPESQITNPTPAQAATMAITSIVPTMNNENFDRFRSIWGTSGDNQADYDRYIKLSGYAKVGSAALQGVGAIADAYSYTQLRRDVEKTKSQYETQKKIIDTNIDNTESALLENLRENMANLDVMTAAQNVDISSQAIQGDKAKGAMDLGEDVAAMRQSGALQKAALDLEYAMNVKRARKAELNSYVGAALQIGGAALSLI